ncbi:MAG: hypothetical protein LPK58_08725 [Gammaproteobacteria bacterium]|nr:hypothetical protein [Gammaproteobacteria bacterium]MDX5503667.1 hypothetical protein [Halomonas sp.]
MTTQPQLHPSIVAMIALAASIASNHPSKGLCQLARLRELGIPEHQIDTLIEVARHIRDEAGDKLDAIFDEEAAQGQPAAPATTSTGSCCGTTASGQSCC